ncbi:MAG: hypothetical protein ACK526_08875 [Planctomyces sp.]|jgi:hypothetical protein
MVYFPKSSLAIRFRPVLFRVAAIAAGILVLAAVELLCVLFGWGSTSGSDDPFDGFVATRPLFVESQDRKHLEVSPARRGFFEHDFFSREKAPEEFRIFVFGGSTVQGAPWSIETSFTRFLELALNRVEPNRKWKVVNCGGISYATFRLLPLMSECLKYQPDLYIFCEGHNEFLEEVSYQPLLKNGDTLNLAYVTFSRFRTFQLLCEVLGNNQSLGGRRNSFGIKSNDDEVDAILDHAGGLQSYHRDDQRAEFIANRFRSCLRQMISSCGAAGVPLLIIQPPSALRDSPPFKSEFSTTDRKEQELIETLIRDAAAQIAENPAASVQQLKLAVEKDPRYAFAWYRLGDALLTAGLIDDASASLIRARDEDVCPLRMTSALEQAMQEEVSAASAEFLNAHAVIADHSENRITGLPLLVDHVHPSFAGHQLIALSVLHWMVQKEYVTIPEITGLEKGAAAALLREQTLSLFSSHLQELNSLYFLKGQRRLKDQKGWASGHAEEPPMVDEPD